MVGHDMCFSAIIMENNNGWPLRGFHYLDVEHGNCFKDTPVHLLRVFFIVNVKEELLKSLFIISHKVILKLKTFNFHSTVNYIYCDDK